MGIVISKQKKIEYLAFIKANFNTYSQRKMAQILGLGKTTVNRWAKEIGLVFKKHTVNENYFSKLTNESAYILGFIYADGNITWNKKKGYYSMTITASQKDEKHLELIRQKIKSTKPLLYSKKTNSYRLIVNNKRFCKSLMNLGVIPKKSLIVEFPTISKKLLPHFLRGVIDGDGNIRYVKRSKSPYFEITLATGSKKFAQGFIEVVKKSISVDAKIRLVKNTNTHIIQYSCSRGEKLAKYIYKDAKIFLDRKNKPYIENVLGGKQKW